MTVSTPHRQRRTLDPKVDVVFNLLFGAEQNRRLLISLLNEVLRPASPITAVTVLPPRPETATVEDKYVFLDLRVSLENGEQIDVEMQTRRHPALWPRLLFYWAKMYTGQLQRGDGYSKLKRCVVILIADFVAFASSRFHSIFQITDSASGLSLCDHFEVHVLELPKLRNVLAGRDEPALAAWCRFLSAQTDEELEALAMQHPILKDAKESLDALSTDPVAREHAERRDSELKLYEFGLSIVREEERILVKRQTLQRQLTRKFGDLETNVAARLSTANEDQLDRWLDRILEADALNSVFDAG